MCFEGCHTAARLRSVGLTRSEESIQTIIGWSSVVTGFTDGFIVIFSSHIHHALLSRSLCAGLHIQFVYAVQSMTVLTGALTSDASGLQHLCLLLPLQNYTVITD